MTVLIIVMIHNEVADFSPVQAVNGDKTTELTLLHAYLSVRTTQTERYCSDGLRSDEGDSFVSHRQSRGRESGNCYF